MLENNNKQYFLKNCSAFENTTASHSKNNVLKVGDIVLIGEENVPRTQ